MKEITEAEREQAKKGMKREGGKFIFALVLLAAAYWIAKAANLF